MSAPVAEFVVLMHADASCDATECVHRTDRPSAQTLPSNPRRIQDIYVGYRPAPLETSGRAGSPPFGRWPGPRRRQGRSERSQEIQQILRQAGTHVVEEQIREQVDPDVAQRRARGVPVVYEGLWHKAHPVAENSFVPFAIE